jgi:glycosyltransferase involved in cell wall biosynthesis
VVSGWSAEHPVVHVGDTAGVPALLMEGLGRLGVPVVGFSPEVPNPHAHGLRKLLDARTRFAHARRGLRGLSPSVLHVHYATAALWYLDRHPLVVHCHGSDVRDVGGARRQILRAIFSRADLLLYSTPDLAPHVPPAARYLPNPVDTDRFRPDPPGEPVARGDVLVFSAVSEVKGADRLISIVGALARARPDLRITAVDLGDRVGELAAAGADVIARQPQEALPALLCAHSVVIGQQHLRALGTAELQAMACGRPVVVVADPDLYPDPPPVLAPSGTEDAAAEVLRLIADPVGAEKVGTAARAWVERHHAVDSVARTLAAWYEELRGAG